jgi:uncharacterized Zn finger protein
MGVDKKVLEKAGQRKILGAMLEWNGQGGMFLVSGEYGTDTHVVRVEQIGDKLEAFCSCMGFAAVGICAHIVLVFKHIVELDSKKEELVEKWLKARREERKKKQ